MISHQAPELCQFADEELIREIGALVYPHFVERTEGENGLRLWVEGSTPDDQTRETARLQFRVLLGAIRSWRDGAGELEVEQQDGLGPAAARDQDGNQWMALGGARVYILSGDPQLMFGADVAAAISLSVNLTNSLWLNGRTSRNAADYYMIHEYAEREFGGTDGIRSALGLSVGSQKRLTQSANNLSPHEGGRHVETDHAAPWSLLKQERYVADMLQRWVFRLTYDRVPEELPYGRRSA